jgi:S-DNA-T family DNA segregation ATPase FtsK/SpoIIIE
VRQAAQKKMQNSARGPIVKHMKHRLREGFFILSIALALFLWISFTTYHNTDPGWSRTGLAHHVANWGGHAGSFFADLFLSLFGWMAYLVPPMIALAGWIGLQFESDEEDEFRLGEFIFKAIGFIFILICGCGLINLTFTQHVSYLPADSGGILGDLISSGLTLVFNRIGGILFLIAVLLCSITIFTGFSWVGSIDFIRKWRPQRPQWMRNFNWQFLKRTKKTETAKSAMIEPVFERIARKPNLPADPKIIELPRTPIVKTASKKTVPSSVVLTNGKCPPLTLLDPPQPPATKAFSHLNFEELSVLVEQRLLDFGVGAKVVAVHPGPVITRFELELAPGIKVSKITGLAKDIARSLSVTSVRVVEVIPGKSVIGLELPNEHRELVCLRDLLESQSYVQSRSPVSLSLGKDIAGYPVIVDLAKMPHLLVAGTTGSGKSVSLNAMLLSMLFKATPEQLRLILIDPKMLELSVYEGIPHLLTPVITDMKDAANALRWCVAEMDRRYKLMALLGVRNLAGYNIKIADSIKQGNPISTPEWLMAQGNQTLQLEPLPMIVVVADELADMMMVVGKKVEDLVTRIAQKARAAGIHLILATQRPSVDVITGLIKANVPTRIAFQVSSRIDSRTILDQQGAEQLLGNGDMLYLPSGAGMPVRVHGAYVADDEVHRVVAAWQTYGKPTYLEEVTEGEGDGMNGEDASGEQDPLYDEALRIVTESRRASISLVQRRLRIGYNRAARIMEDMEKAGVVSGMDTSGSREVLAPPPV